MADGPAWLDLLVGASLSEGEHARRSLELEADPDARRELEGLREVLQAARRHDRRTEWSAARETRLVRRVLSHTTRLDPGWRGDLRLVFDFARDRIARSPQLRAAAALLLVHSFVVVPALAWTLLRTPRSVPHFFTDIVAPAEPGVDTEVEQLEVALGPEAAAERDEERRRDARVNLRRRARFLLQNGVDRAATGEPQTLPDPSTLGELSGDERRAALLDALRAERAALVAGLRPVDAGSQPLEAWSAAAETADERALVALLGLDRSVVLGRPAALGALLNPLALAEAEGALTPLGRFVLDRARLQGDWPTAPPAGWEGLEDERVLPGGEAEADALRAALGTRAR